MSDELHSVIEPVVAGLGLELVDVEMAGRTLRVTVDREGGVDLEAITSVTQALNPVLERTGPKGSYTLEVSSPGVERPLRTPAHFARAVGEQVSIKSRNEDGAAVRRHGVIIAAGPESVEVDFDGTREQLAYTDITQARTVFEWGPPPRPSKPARTRAKEHSR